MPAVSNLSTSPIHADLARALAEAVAGTFTPTTEMYFTASFTQLSNAPLNPYDVSGPYYVPDPQEAQTLGDGYGIFGPFLNTMNGLRDAILGQTDVTELQVATSKPSGFSLPNDIPPGVPGIPDALFLSVEAVAKFVVPYYTNVYGPQMAQEMLTAFQESTLALLIHLPWSESEFLDPEGEPTGIIPDIFSVLDHTGVPRWTSPRSHES